MGAVEPRIIRQAMWDERELAISYVSGADVRTERRIWPLAVVFLDRVPVALCRCLLRDAFRGFRLDRIEAAEETGESYRPHRVALLRAALAERLGG